MILKKCDAKFYLFFILLCFSQIGWTQQKTFTGTVVDEVTSEPLVGVTVKLKNSPNVGTVTNIDGAFSIKLSDGDVLQLSYVGYVMKEVKVKNTSVKMKITLEESKQELEEVVVVGYGAQKKNSVVAAISQTSGKELEKVGGVTSMSQAIQGLLPGVITIMDNGKPGADAAEILIRGKSSWNSSAPLILVDGIERNFNDVDPNEVETISTLKDASATAVYGVKGANGVILITTKRGTNDKPKINFSANFGFKQPTAKPEFSDYVTTLTYWNEALRNDNQWDSLVPESTIDAWRNAYATGNYGPYNDYFPEVDWWDEVTKKVGYQQNYNINVRGGTDFVNYFVSLGYLNDGDIFNTKKNDLFDPAFRYQRYNWRTNFDFNVTKTTKIGVNLAGKYGYRNQAGYRIDGDGEDGFGQAKFFESLYRSPRNQYPIKYSDGYWACMPGGDSNKNIYADMNDLGQRIYKYYQGFFDVNLNQKLDFITKGLSVKALLSYTTYSNTQSRIQKQESGHMGEDTAIRYYRTWDYAHPNGDGTYPLLDETRIPDDDTQELPPSASYDNMLSGGYGKKLYYEFSLNYARKFGDHDVSFLALMNRQKSEGLNNTSNLKFPSYEEAWVGRATYGWKSRYLAEVNAAYTGSEKFAPGKRFGFFPSYSVGWRISEEPIIKKYFGSFLTNMKIRYSYGAVGSDKGSARFNYIQTYSSGDNIKLGSNQSTQYGPLYKEGAAADPNATWETAYKQNLGVEVSLFDRLDISLDFFKEKREGILMTRETTPLWFGIKDASANIGKTKNRGMELELGWHDKIGENVNYYIKANMALNQNRIVYKDDPNKRPEYQKAAGKPIGWQKAHHVWSNYQFLDDVFNYAIPENITQQGKILPGDFMYIDYNADGVIDSKDQMPLDRVQYPSQTYGISFGGSYKNFSLNVTFYGASGMTRNMPQLVYWDFLNAPNGIYLSTPEVGERWQPGMQGVVRPTFHSTNVAGYNRKASTYSYKDYGYLRLKNLELAYSITPKFLDFIGCRKIQFYMNGNNLFTITSLSKYIDPETSGAGVYPMVRRYNIGFRIDL
jgi:TonB-linked SusC/RagA family outer membrane protein